MACQFKPHVLSGRDKKVKVFKNSWEAINGEIMHY